MGGSLGAAAATARCSMPWRWDVPRRNGGGVVHHHAQPHDSVAGGQAYVRLCARLCRALFGGSVMARLKHRLVHAMASARVS